MCIQESILFLLETQPSTSTLYVYLKVLLWVDKVGHLYILII